MCTYQNVLSSTEYIFHIFQCKLSFLSDVGPVRVVVGNQVAEDGCMSVAKGYTHGGSRLEMKLKGLI